MLLRVERRFEIRSRRAGPQVRVIIGRARRENMSKLIEKLERISEGRGQPFGFGPAANRVKTLPLVVIATLPEGDARAAAAAAAAKVDAVLVTGASPRKADAIPAKLMSEMPDIPWGVSLDSVTRDDMERLAGAGCDFVVFSIAGSRAAALNAEKPGKVLRIDPSLDENLARTISRLQVDAVFLQPAGKGEGGLTVEQLLVYEWLVGVSGKYPIAAMPPGMPVEDIESLWALGVVAVAADLAVSDPAERLSRIKEAMEKLPAKRRRSKGRFMASLPVSSGVPSSEPPDEEEEGDE